MIAQADREIDPCLIHRFFDLRFIFFRVQVTDDQDHFHGIYRLERHFQGDFHHLGEGQLTFFGAGRFVGHQGIGDRNQAGGFLVEIACVRKECEGFHFDGDASMVAIDFLECRRPCTAIEDIAGMDPSLRDRDVQLERRFFQTMCQFRVGILDIFRISEGGGCETRFAVGAVREDDVIEFDLVGIRAGRADPDDALDAVLGIEFKGIDPDAGHSHARSHDRDRMAFIGSGIPEHIANIVELDDVFKEGFRDHLRTKGVSRHEDGFRDLAGHGRVVRCWHVFSPISTNIIAYSHQIPQECHRQVEIDDQGQGIDDRGDQRGRHRGRVLLEDQGD